MFCTEDPESKLFECMVEIGPVYLFGAILAICVEIYFHPNQHLSRCCIFSLSQTLVFLDRYCPTASNYLYMIRDIYL